jgi:hypothetical protein
MTLILTELSQAGIAMAADSAISMSVNGKLVTKGQKHWKKLLKVPRIKAGISYWGDVGRLIGKKDRFDEWLERKIQNRCYTDLRSFADYLAYEMNLAIGNKPLGNDQQVGIHVAGFQPWADGVSRPTFYHIHNGHSHPEIRQRSANINGQTVVLETIVNWKFSPRELFTTHDDFSPESRKADALPALPGSYLTQNGDYVGFHIIFANLRPLIAILNTMPEFSILTKPNELGTRVGFLKNLIEITISIYKCSSMPKSIGGKVLALGIRADGSYVGG